MPLGVDELKVGGSRVRGVARIAKRDPHRDDVVLRIQIGHPEGVALQVGAGSGGAAESRHWAGERSRYKWKLKRDERCYGDCCHYRQTCTDGAVRQQPLRLGRQSGGGNDCHAWASRSTCSTDGAVMKRMSSSPPIASYALIRSFASPALLIAPCHTRGPPSP